MVMFFNHHTNYSIKETGNNWSSFSKISGYNNGEQHFFELNDDGIGAAVWITPESGSDNLYLSIYK